MEKAFDYKKELIAFLYDKDFLNDVIGSLDSTESSAMNPVFLKRSRAFFAMCMRAPEIESEEGVEVLDTFAMDSKHILDLLSKRADFNQYFLDLHWLFIQERLYQNDVNFTPPIIESNAQDAYQNMMDIFNEAIENLPDDIETEPNRDLDNIEWYEWNYNKNSIIQFYLSVTQFVSKNPSRNNVVYLELIQNNKLIFKKFAKILFTLYSDIIDKGLICSFADNILHAGVEFPSKNPSLFVKDFAQTIFQENMEALKRQIQRREVDAEIFTSLKYYLSLMDSTMAFSLFTHFSSSIEKMIDSLQASDPSLYENLMREIYEIKVLGSRQAKSDIITLIANK